MNVSVSVSPADVLTEGQRAALISLLSDEDPAVYETVRAKLLSFGPLAGEWLQPHLASTDPLLRRRSREIVLHLSRQRADRRFLDYCLGGRGELDLEEGTWRLAQTRYPEFSLEAYRALLDKWAGELRPRTDPKSHPEANLLAINQHLFQRLGFRGDPAHHRDADSSYLNRVMDRRMGNPISLCTLYLLVARRLPLAVTGIGLPGHFLCRYQCSTCEVYIDCFNQGRFLTKADCIRYLVQSRCSPGEGHLLPLNSRRMLMRMCANLHQIHLHQDRASEALRFQRYMAALGH